MVKAEKPAAKFIRANNQSKSKNTEIIMFTEICRDDRT